MRQFPFLHSLFKKILKPFENIKQKVTSKKKKNKQTKNKKNPNLKTNHIPEIDKTLNGNLLKRVFDAYVESFSCHEQIQVV
jgi:hypothetical protein